MDHAPYKDLKSTIVFTDVNGGNGVERIFHVGLTLEAKMDFTVVVLNAHFSCLVDIRGKDGHYGQ